MQRAVYYPGAGLMYIFRDVLVDGEHQAPNTEVAWAKPLRPRPHAPRPVWLVAADDQCAQAAVQTQMLAKWVVVQVAAGQPRRWGLPHGTTLLVVTAVPHDRYMAGHLVVVQSGERAWLREHLKALQFWASTDARAGIRFHDHLATRPNDPLDPECRPGGPPQRRHQVALFRPQHGVEQPHWILFDLRGLGPHARHATSVALAADLAHTWVFAIPGMVPDRQGVPPPPPAIRRPKAVGRGNSPPAAARRPQADHRGPCGNGRGSQPDAPELAPGQPTRARSAHRDPAASEKHHPAEQASRPRPRKVHCRRQ